MPELITSQPGGTGTPEKDGLRNLSRSVAAHLRGNPAEALEHLSTLPQGEDFTEALSARAHLQMELGQYEQAAADFERLQTLRAEDPNVHFRLGTCYFHLNRHAKALEKFSQALQLSPARVDFLVAHGTCLLHLKQPEDALASFRKAIDKVSDQSPELEAALLGQAAALHMCYELEEAEHTYRRVLARNPDSKEVLTNLMILGQQKKDEAMVREYANRLLALDPVSESALLAMSNVSFTAKEFESAALYCARLVKLRPDQHDYWYNLGVAEVSRGNLDASARAFENAASADSTSASAYLACAAVFEKMGDNAAARVSLDRALRLAPQRIDVRYHIGQLAERQGMGQEAASVYEGVLAEDPKHLGARFRLGFGKLERGDYPGAAQCFEACLAERPHWPEAEINLSLAYSKLNRMEEAQAILERLLAREPGSMDALRGAAAISVANTPQNSIEKLQKLREAGDCSPEVLFNAGVLHQQAGQWKEAIASYREALAANPQFAEALVNLGHSLLASDDPKAARESWAAAVEIKPQLARGYY